MLPTFLAEPPPGLLAGLPDQSALFLDFDGTLVEIAPTPTGITPDPGLHDLLGHLARLLQGRLAIVSGRSVADIARWLPGYAGIIAGSHGGEIRWADGRIDAPHRPPALDEALAEAQQLAADHPGVTIEDKSFGVGLHFRNAPQHGEAVQQCAARLAAQHGLTLQHGKMVAELRSAGFDKGTAIRRMMTEPLFSAAKPVFIGDDLTDIPAMDVVTEQGGSAIMVGDLDGTNARYRFADVAQTLDWLKQECTL